MDSSFLLNNPILLFVLGILSALGCIALLYISAINFPETKISYINFMCKPS